MAATSVDIVVQVDLPLINSAGSTFDVSYPTFLVLRAGVTDQSDQLDRVRNRTTYFSQ